ncbi:MAG: hypothetical protein GEU98_09160 [Pseudonocardiaceae bacterium]|nr:hypothetical protein [Pseudonocardiaceae bacterium]
MPSIAPSGVGVNEYYGSEEEYFSSVAEAMSTEYRAIVDAGFLLQIDDPFLTEVFSFAGLSEGERRARGEMWESVRLPEGKMLMPGSSHTRATSWSIRSWSRSGWCAHDEILAAARRGDVDAVIAALDSHRNRALVVLKGILAPAPHA